MNAKASKKRVDELNGPFSREYYETLNYSSYLDRGPRYASMVKELHDRFLSVTGIVKKDSTILDYGCAVGFTVKAFRDLGYERTFGFDVSGWAIDWGWKNLGLNGKATSNDSTILNRFNSLGNGELDLMLALDVFEHMTKDEIKAVIRRVHPRYLVVRIPLAVKNGGKFVLNVSEQDPTHITRLDRDGWDMFIASCMDDGDEYCSAGHFCDLNLSHIYDTDGVMCSVYRSW